MTSIKIGYSLPLSGTHIEFGQSAFLSHKIWEENVNKKGGLLGRKVELMCIDNKSSTDESIKIYKKLMDNEKVDLLLGGFGSSSTSAAISLIQERQKFFVSLMSKTNGTNHCFTMIPLGTGPDTDLTEIFFKSLPENSSFVIIAADCECTKNSVAGAKENIIKNSQHLIFEYKYSLETFDFRELAQKLKLFKPEAIYIAAYASELLGVIQAINDIGFFPKKIGSSIVQHFDLRNIYCGVDEFMEEYLSRTTSIAEDTLGYSIAPQAYAQMQIIEEAVRATNSLNDNKLIGFTREAIFKTILGDIKFDKNGECRSPEMYQLQYQKNIIHDEESVLH